MKILRILIISAAIAANLNAAINLDTTKYANNLILEVAQSEGCTDYLTAANSSTSIKEAAASTDGGGAPFTAFVSINGTPITKDQVKFSVVMGKAMTTRVKRRYSKHESWQAYNSQC
jgi:hypothetical protein